MSTLATNIVPELQDDSLEYYIKFPSSNYRCTPEDDAVAAASAGASAQHGDNDYVLVYNESNVPIVLLLGWAGCQDKYLMKYSKIYEDKGLITVRYTAPVENLFWKRSAMQQIGEKILKLIFDMNFDSHPIIFHVFSNGGAYLYQHITAAMRRSNKSLKVCGMIFDSAPGERRILGLYRATLAIFGRNRTCSCFISWILTILMYVVWMCEEAQNSLKNFFSFGEPAHSTNPFNSLKDDDTDWPQLFVYTKKDLLIPYTDIEKFARHREKRGVKVQTIRFEDCEHVKIYTRHPQQYVQCICKFISECLALPYYRNTDTKAMTKFD